MKKLINANDLKDGNYPKLLLNRLKSDLTILDTEYGADRNADLEGGYTLILESDKDVTYVKENIFDITTYPPEYVDRLLCEDKSNYIVALFILNNDFGILCICEEALAKTFIANELEELDDENKVIG